LAKLMAERLARQMVARMDGESVGQMVGRMDVTAVGWQGG
jgi:hypothetical protein